MTQDIELANGGRLIRAPSTTEFHLMTGAELSSNMANQHGHHSPGPGKRLLNSHSSHHLGYHSGNNGYHSNGRGGNRSGGINARRDEAAVAAANKKESIE